MSVQYSMLLIRIDLLPVYVRLKTQIVDFRTCKIDQSIATSQSQITVIGHVIKMLNMPFISCFLFIKAVMKLNKSFKK